MRDRSVERRIFAFARLLVAVAKILTLVGLTSLSARAESITFWQDFQTSEHGDGQAFNRRSLPTFDSTFGTLTDVRFTLDVTVGGYVDISPKVGMSNFDTSFDASVSIRSELILFDTRNGYLGNGLFGGSLTFDTGVAHIQSGDERFLREQYASLVLHSNGHGDVNPESFSTFGPQETAFEFVSVQGYSDVRNFESFSTLGPQEAEYIILQLTSWRGPEIYTDVIPFGNRIYTTWASGRVGVTYDYISAIPEPQTYAMMLAGLGLLGVVARRRNQKLNA